MPCFSHYLITTDLFSTRNQFKEKCCTSQNFLCSGDFCKKFWKEQSRVFLHWFICVWFDINCSLLCKQLLQAETSIVPCSISDGIGSPLDVVVNLATQIKLSVRKNITVGVLARNAQPVGEIESHKNHKLQNTTSSWSELTFWWLRPSECRTLPVCHTSDTFDTTETLICQRLLFKLQKRVN